MNKINLLLNLGLTLSLHTTTTSATSINDTGITKCSDATKNTLPCPVAGFPGQDAEYGSNNFDLTKLDANGNPLPVTVTNHVCVQDHTTGLTWEVKTNDGGSRDKDNKYSFNTASQFASQVNTAGLCGHNDWRIPTPQELISIVNYSVPYYSSTMDTNYFSDKSVDIFWTVTTNAANPDQAWNIFFYNGQLDSQDQSYLNVVRLVRGPQLITTWSDNGDGTTNDLNNRLMWAKCPDGQSGNNCEIGTAANYTWSQALTAARNFRLGGYSDWRLPNIKELQSLVTYDTANPSIDDNLFPATPSQNFWSASTSTYITTYGYSWYSNFDDGKIFYLPRNSVGVIRAVRDLPPVALFNLSITKNGDGSGTITSNPTGINCGATCNTVFADGTNVILTATASTGSIFNGWSGACSGTATTYTVTMDVNKNCTAKFIYWPRLPTAITQAATNVTKTSATLNGNVASNGATTTVTFDLGTTTSYDTSVNATPGQVYSNTAIAVSANKIDLTCNTTYNYRVKAVNSVGTTTGVNQSFKTLDCSPPPTVKTDLPENITVTTATLVGLVTPNGAATDATFELGKTDGYGFNLPAAQNPIAANAASTKVTYAAGGLDCNTNYYYRVKAVSSAGTSFGGNIIFTTSACPKTPHALLIGGATATTDPVGNAGISSQLGLVYSILKKQGYSPDRDEIKILGNRLTVTFNGTAVAVQPVQSSDFAAGTALTKWVQVAERLVIYLIGHGEVGYFDLDQTTGDKLTAQNLKTWLDLVQPNLTNITFIDESCHSGSFLPTLTIPPTSASEPKRILLASAAADQMAVFMANGRVSYSQIFWLNILAGFNLKDAHHQALLWLENLGNPQVPQLEADGDPATTDNNGADLQLANNFCLGFSMNGSTLTTNKCIPFLASTPSIESVTAAQTFNGVRVANLALTAATSTGISSAWAVIERPDYQLDPTQSFASLPTIALTQDAANPARWVGRYAPGDLGSDGNLQRGLDVRGEYKIDYYVESSDGLVSASKSTSVTQNIGFTPYYTTPALFYVGQNQLSLPTAQLWDAGLSRSVFTRATTTSLFQINSLVSLSNSSISNTNPPRWNVGSTGSPSVVNIPQLIQSGDTKIYRGTLKRESATGTQAQWTFSFSTAPFLCGDADGNSVVNIVDALAVARKVVNLPPPPAVTEMADVDSNGQIAVADALNIAKFAIGLTVSNTCLN